MRTSLKLDDDLLRAARRLAKERGVSLGQIVSGVVRATPGMRNGVPLFAPKPETRKPNPNLVNELRDDACGGPPE